VLAEELEKALFGLVEPSLARDLVSSFLELKQDAVTGVTGRSGAGKFVETVVQSLQWIETGRWDSHPAVDEYLRTVESRPTSMDDGLRICMARIARSMYSLRNKRSIAHKGEVDPNSADLRMLYAAAQWCMTELLRRSKGVTMEEAGALMLHVQAPISQFVEDCGGKRLVLAELPAADEILALLHSYYPESVRLSRIISDLDRVDESTVRKAINRLWRGRRIEKVGEREYRLTQLGFGDSEGVIAHSIRSSITTKMA
jgi:hypothetical protein